MKKTLFAIVSICSLFIGKHQAEVREKQSHLYKVSAIVTSQDLGNVTAEDAYGHLWSFHAPDLLEGENVVLEFSDNNTAQRCDDIVIGYKEI